MTHTKLDLQAETGQRWYALGFATRPDTVTSEATAMQGYHNKHILVIFDEAAGILPQIWKAAEHLLTSGHTRWLAIGNPTAPQGAFIDAIEGGDWHPINISVLDTPNFVQAQTVIPGVSGRNYEAAIRTKYSQDSNEYKVRVLGQKPDFGEGTFFGAKLARAMQNDQIGFFPPRPDAKVWTAWDIGSTHTVIWFVQFVREHIRVVDFYYDSGGAGMPAYAALLQQRGYTYGGHIAPWDVGGTDARDKSGPNAKNVQTGRYLLDTAKELGIGFDVVEKTGRDTQIAAGQDIIGMSLFHENAVSEGLNGLSQYRKKLNASLSTPDKPVYYNEPVKDWTEHVGSAWCTLAMYYRYSLLIDDVRVGYSAPIRTFDDGPYVDKYDPLTYNIKTR